MWWATLVREGGGSMAKDTERKLRENRWPDGVQKGHTHKGVEEQASGVFSCFLGSLRSWRRDRGVLTLSEQHGKGGSAEAMSREVRYGQRDTCGGSG